MLPEGAAVQGRLVVDNRKDSWQHAEEQHEQEHCQVEVVGSAERAGIMRQHSLQSPNEGVHITTQKQPPPLWMELFFNQGPGQMAQLLKRLLHKREDLSLIPQHSCEKAGVAGVLEIPAMGRERQESP